MQFSRILEENVEYNIIECEKLDNNIIIAKKMLDDNQYNVLKLKENQYVVLFKNGRVFDILNEEGIYYINLENDDTSENSYEDYIIRESNELCLIFFNMNIIEKNKFYIKKTPKKDFFGEGEFEFIIENPLKLLNKVIKIRNLYSKEELLEQIRERISKIMTFEIKEMEENLAEERFVKLKLNIFEEYGIKIISYTLDELKFK